MFLTHVTVFISHDQSKSYLLTYEGAKNVYELTKEWLSWLYEHFGTKTLRHRHTPNSRSFGSHIRLSGFNYAG